VVQNYRDGNLGICATIRVRGEAHSMLIGENLVSARSEQTKMRLWSSVEATKSLRLPRT
jgi:hypothetical protein